MASGAQAIKAEDGAIRVETGRSLETEGEGTRAKYSDTHV